jgi:hypothetical protein
MRINIQWSTTLRQNHKSIRHILTFGKYETLPVWKSYRYKSPLVLMRIRIQLFADPILVSLKCKRNWIFAWKIYLRSRNTPRKFSYEPAWTERVNSSGLVLQRRGWSSPTTPPSPASRRFRLREMCVRTWKGHESLLVDVYGTSKSKTTLRKNQIKNRFKKP